LSGVYSGSGLFSFSGDASAPVGYHGARAGLSGGHLRYALGREFAPLGATGLSDTAGGYATYPLRRTLHSSADLRLDLQGKSIKGDISATSSHSKEAAMEALVSLSGARTDSWLKSGSTQFRLVYTAGQLFLQDDAGKAFDAATARTAGHFDKLSYLLRREELIAPRWTIFASVSGQLAGKNLDSSEKFGLTGPTAVRAYSAGEVSSDIATLLTLETRIGLPPGLARGHQITFAPFYDRGWATFNKNAWTGFAGPLSGTFSGGGAYLSVVSPGRYSLRATWAIRDGAPPTAAANDARSQVWLEAATAF
jgi:hemolysin activation/secretion protein